MPNSGRDRKMRNSKHLRRAGQHASEGSSPCPFVQKSSPFGEDSGGESGGSCRTLSRGSPDAVLRCRCKVILALVQGKSPTAIAEGGLCSASQVYRVAHRFLDQGPARAGRSPRGQRREQGHGVLRVGVALRRGRVPPRPRLREADLDPGAARPWCSRSGPGSR